MSSTASWSGPVCCTGGIPARTERNSTWTPATYAGGRLSTHWPGPPSRACVASTDARIASRGSTTRFGRPVEPEVSITSGAGASAASHAWSSARSCEAVPRTGCRLAPVPGSLRPVVLACLTGATLCGPGDLAGSSLVATPAQWIEGARPRTLPAAVSPVLAGTGVAAFEDQAGWWKAVLALVAALALQVGVNYANDYSDGIRGTDEDRVGPLRLVGSGSAGPREVKVAAFVAFGLAAVLGLVLAATTAWWLVGVGGLCIVAAWFYTGGSSPYGYRGLGEVMVFVFFGLVAVVGTTYVQTTSLPLASLYAAVGVGALACAILVANNLRDVPTDRSAGKRTLAVGIGDERTRYLYALLVGAAAVALVAVALDTSRWALLGFVFLLPAVPATRLVLSGTTGRGLVPGLQRTGVAELLFAAGMFAGLVVAGLAG